MVQTNMVSSSKRRDAIREQERVFYIDWLRILAVLLLIPFHTARIFDIWEDFYVKNGETNAALTYGIVGWLNYWHMPLLFLLAGAATFFALGKRGAGGYVLERIKRLVIPLVFGVLVIVPPQGYVAALFHSTFAGSWLEYLPYYFTPHHATTDYTGLIFTVGHLWFILFLFIIVLLALPVVLFFQHDLGRSAISKLASLCDKPGAILLFFIPLFIANFLPDLGGKNLFLYLIVFIYGFLLMADSRFRDAVARHGNVALVLAIGSIFIMGALRGSGFNSSYHMIVSILMSLLSAICTWTWLVALLSLGQRFLNINHRFLRYANEAAYPFYILHQTVIVLVGYYVVQWDLPVAVKFLAIAATALSTTLAVYHWIVKRNNVTRFLFGMKPLPPAPRAAKQRAAGHAA